MSRRQSQFLDGLLKADQEPDPEPPRSARSSLLTRETALSRLATGEVQQVTQLRLDPARCRIWEGNGREYSLLTEVTCGDLIESLIAEGGQRVPVIIRHIKDDPLHDYELMVGSRRHWSIAWLRANNYPDMMLLANVQDIDDEAAFRLADLENRNRTDLSDLERARNYAQALDRHYSGVQARMAERLRVSKGWLTKMLALAHIPDTVISAYPCPTALQVKGGYELSILLSDQHRASLIIAEAEAITGEQQNRRSRNDSPISGPDVTRRLLASTKERRGRRPTVPILSAAGKPLFSILSDRADGLTIRLHPGSEATDTEIAEQIANAIKAARITKLNVKK